MTADMQDRFRKLSLRWKLAIFAIGALVVSPIVFLVVKGIVGLIIAFAVASLSIALAPVWAMKLANWRLKGVIAEAAKNPIETRWNIYHERVKLLENFAEKIEAFTAKIGMFDSQLQGLRKTYPDDVAPFEKMLNGMRALKAQREAEYKRTQSKLQQYRRETEKAEAIWNLALSARDLKIAAGVTVDPLKEIAEKTALDRVELEMNAAFAQLDRLMLERVEEPEPLALPAPVAEVVPLLTERVKVRR